MFDEIMAGPPEIGKKQVLLLGRYSFDLDRIKNAKGCFKINKGTGIVSYEPFSPNGHSQCLTARFLTVHGAKGLEADIVILLNCNAGKYGFPSQVSDDPFLNLMLSQADQFENGEERRLFYLAMTRAKEKVYFIADRAAKSKFILELERESGNLGLRKCPRCVTADLVKRSGIKNGKPWAFWGCANYAYGCDYQEWIN
jgi:DNA helicase-4